MDTPMTLQSLLGTALIAGPIISLVTMVARKLAAKAGMEVAGLIIHGAIFVVAIVIALVLKFAPEDLLVTAGAILTTAVTFYELVVKNLVQPVLNKAFNKGPGEPVEETAPDILP